VILASRRQPFIVILKARKSLKNPGLKKQRHGFFTAFRMTMGGNAFSLLNGVIIVSLSRQPSIVILNERSEVKNPGLKSLKDKRHGFFACAGDMTMGDCVFFFTNGVIIVRFSNQVSIVFLANEVSIVHLSNQVSIVIPDLIRNPEPAVNLIQDCWFLNHPDSLPAVTPPLEGNKYMNSFPGSASRPARIY
jgi:hypothetical protein